MQILYVFWRKPPVLLTTWVLIKGQTGSLCFIFFSRQISKRHTYSSVNSHARFPYPGAVALYLHLYYVKGFEASWNFFYFFSFLPRRVTLFTAALPCSPPPYPITVDLPWLQLFQHTFIWFLLWAHKAESRYTTRQYRAGQSPLVELFDQKGGGPPPLTLTSQSKKSQVPGPSPLPGRRPRQKKKHSLYNFLNLGRRGVLESGVLGNYRISWYFLNPRCT